MLRFSLFSLLLLSFTSSTYTMAIPLHDALINFARSDDVITLIRYNHHLTNVRVDGGNLLHAAVTWDCHKTLVALCILHPLMRSQRNDNNLTPVELADSLNKNRSKTYFERCP